MPTLISDSKNFIHELPQTSSRFLHKIETLAHDQGYALDLSKDSIADYFKQNVEGLSGGILKSLGTGLKASFNSLWGWVIAVLNIFLIPLFFYYLISDYERYRSIILSFIPQNFQPTLMKYLSVSNDVLSGYIRGQLVVALFLAVLYSTGLALVGLRFGILIGLLSGFISIIPYAGFVLGFFIAVVVALANFTGIGLIIGVVAVYMVVQFLESFIITPKLVGDKVGLGSLSTMLALIIGGNLFGFVGMLIGIPLAAILKIILKDLKGT